MTLEIGDRVVIKPYDDIKKTLDSNSRFGCLSFQPEMAKYCKMKCTINKRVSTRKYRLSTETGYIIDWTWDQEWLEVSPKTVKVCLSDDLFTLE